MHHTLTLSHLRRPAMLLPALTLMLAACGGSSSSNEDNDAAIEPDVFVLEEASVADIHAAFRGELLLDNGDLLNCETLANLYIQRIYAYDKTPQPSGGLAIRSVLAINPLAIEQAKTLDAAYARDGGIGDRPIHCMPILLKDNYDTYDYPSTQGSYSMLGHQAGVDANSVAGLRRAGGLILGKANQDEFAFWTTGFSNRGIQVTNPYNTSQSPAGSSSGTGAAIAANFALGGTGSDTCQSIRHPSSVSGLVGIRPSLGVISQHGIFPLSHQRDTGGPMTRTVSDAALMLDAMAGVDFRDPKTLAFPAELRPNSYTDFLDREQHGLKGKNIGIVRQLGDNREAAGTDAQGTLIAEALSTMEALGATIYDVYLPGFESKGAGSRHYDMNEYFATFEAEGGNSPRACVSSLAAALTNGEVAHGRDVCEGLDGIIETGRVGLRTAPLLAAVAVDDLNKAPTNQELADIVAMRDYTTQQMDALLDENGEQVFDNDGNPVRLDALILSPGPTGGRTCDFGSTTQMGSIVVPVGFDDSVGVPRGMEIVVRQFDEGNGIGIAYDYEQATQHRRAPELVASPLSGNETISAFNASVQQAMMDAAAVAPEDLPLEYYLEILQGIGG